MACYHPIPAWQPPTGGPVKLWPPVGTATLQLPCGNCIGCKTDHAADWARRAKQEATSSPFNCFVTLTYDDAHLPYGGYLEPKDLQHFVKRLRRAVDRHEPTITTTRNIRFLACGEYGDKNKRPHYHILLFNCDFSDKKTVGTDLYESPTLAKYWKLGNHKIGDLTGASANYVAQYTLKKAVTPDRVLCDADGVVIPQPFLRASTKPPIGNIWLQKFSEDLKHGYLIDDGVKNRIPRAIKKQLAKLNPQLAEQASFKAATHTRGVHNLTAAEIIHKQKALSTQQRPL